MRKEVGWQWYHSIVLALSWSRGNFQTKWYRPHSVRGIKLLRDPFFYYLQTIIVFQYRLSFGQRHTFHIIHLIDTTVLYFLPDIWDDGKDRLTMINLFKKSYNSVRYLECRQRKIAMFEFTTWHASFTDFFIKLRSHTYIWKQNWFQMTKTSFAEQF
jgi:hypothetical protein